MTPPVLNNDKRLFKLGGVIHLVDPIGIEPTTLRMRTVRSRKVVSFLPTDRGVWFDENAGRGADTRNTTPSFSIRRELTANLYTEKTESYFFSMTICS